jgi:hypothetical protein
VGVLGVAGVRRLPAVAGAVAEVEPVPV